MKKRFHIIVDYPINGNADVGAKKYIDTLSEMIKSLGFECIKESIYSEIPPPRKFLEALNLLLRLTPVQVIRRSQIKPREGNGKIIIYGLDNYKLARTPKDAILIAGDSLSRLKKSIYANEKNPIKKIYSLISLYAYLYLEKKVYPQFEKVFFVSPEDLIYAKKITGAENLHLSEIFLTKDDFTSSPRPITLPEKYIVFTGNMSYPPNLDAAERIYKKYTRDCKKNTDFDLVLAGPGSDSFAGKHSRVHALGRVDDIRTVISNSICYVSPLLSGSGLKNKVLEAFALSAPLIATPKTVEGFTGISSETHYIEYSEEIDLNQQVEQCKKKSAELVKNAMTYALQFTPERSLLKIIESP